jgi:hypothetical protein
MIKFLNIIIFILLALTSVSFADPIKFNSSPVINLGKNIFTAAANGDIDFITNYKGKIEKPDVDSGSGWFPIMYAVKYGQTEALKQLIKMGADVDAGGQHVNIDTAYEGSTPLMFAVKFRQSEAFDELMKMGADVNIQSSAGTTALMLAARNGDTDILKKLISAGADENLEDCTGLSAMSFSSNQEVLNLLKIAKEQSFNAELHDMAALGFDTNGFNYQTENIKALTPTINILLPYSEKAFGITVNDWETVVHYQPYENSPYYLDLVNAVVVTNKNRLVSMNIKFPVQGVYQVFIKCYGGRHSRKVCLFYKITVEKDAALDVIGDPLTDNIPIIPTCFFYADGLSMKMFSQKYRYNTVQNGEWNMDVNTSMWSNLFWDVKRPGILFNKKNISMTNMTSGGVTYKIKFPEAGVYIVDLWGKGKSTQLLARYKVRCISPAEDAISNTYFWQNYNPDLQLAKWVMDIPFDWELDRKVLSGHLSNFATNAAELNEMFYDWTTENLYYDWERTTKNIRFSHDLFSSELVSRSFQCDGYALTLNYLCTYSGLHTWLIFGWPLDNSRRFEEHDWSAFDNGGTIQFMDPTWGIFRKNPGDFFFSRSVHSISEYDPTDLKSWIFMNSNSSYYRYINNPFSESNILRLPNIDSIGYFYEMGFRLENMSQTNYEFNTGNTLSMSFSAPAGYKTYCYAINKNNNKIKAVTTVSYVNGSYAANINFPSNGIYAIQFDFNETNMSGLFTRIVYQADVN